MKLVKLCFLFVVSQKQNISKANHPCRHICDGSWQCPFGEDEAACKTHNCAGLFQCVLTTRKLCLHPSSLCDDFQDCSSGEDEYLCDLQGSTCPQFCQCLMYSTVCKSKILITKWDLSSISVHNVHLKIVNITVANKEELKKCSERVIFIWSHSETYEVCPFICSSELQLLDFSFNKILELHSHCFSEAPNLKIILLQQNELTKITKNTFANLSFVLKLDLSHNNLSKVSDIVGAELSLNFLNISCNFFKFTETSRYDVEIPFVLSTDDYRLCCLMESTSVVCQTEPKWPRSCDSLLLSFGARFGIVFIISLNTLLNTVSVGIQYTKYKKKATGAIINILLFGVNDLMFGLVLLFVFGADQYFGAKYFWFAEDWLQNVFCKMLGLVSACIMLNAVFLMNFMSVSRLMIVKHPMKSKLKKPKRIKTIGGIGLVINLLICGLWLATYILVEGRKSMPLGTCQLVGETRESASVKCFTILMSLLQTTSCFSVFVVYALSVKELQKQSKINPQNEKTGKKVTVQAVVIGVGNATCWLPSCALNIISIALHTFPVDMLIWNFILINPLNSVLNPLIYSIVPEIKVKYKQGLPKDE